MSTLFAFLVANQTSLIGIITSIAGLMSMIASMAPGLGSNPTWNFIRQVVDLLAFNFGNAKNHNDTEPKALAEVKHEETTTSPTTGS